jgi:hypothetical protein
MIRHAAWEEIETIITIGDEEILEFEDIPQTYTHLMLCAVGSFHDENIGATPRSDVVVIYFNDDDTAANYNVQGLVGSWTSGGAAAIAGDGGAGNLPAGAYFPVDEAPNYQGNGFVKIPYYRDTNFFKTALERYSAFAPNAPGGSLISATIINNFLWESTNAITKITLASPRSYDGIVSDAIFSTNCKFTLYGIK